MSASPDEILRLRRMCGEDCSETYSDSDLAAYIEAHARTADDGSESYDLHAAAADVWEEKAASSACAIDSTIDGVALATSQRHEHALAMARRHRARSRTRSVAMQSRHDEEAGL